MENPRRTHALADGRPRLIVVMAQRPRNVREESRFLGFSSDWLFQEVPTVSPDATVVADPGVMDVQGRVVGVVTLKYTFPGC